MSAFKKIMMGFLVISLLAACEDQQPFNDDKEAVHAEKEVGDAKTGNDEPLYEAYKYNGRHLYGGWISEGTYLLILRDPISTYTMQRITRDDYEEVRHFEIVKPIDHTMTGVLYNEEHRNRTTTFTLKLNDDHTKLTITMPDEPPVTYKQTVMEPNEFNPTYEWEFEE
ncbi:MAG: hypothetical protein ACI35J_02005 [Peribacillus sp.]